MNELCFVWGPPCSGQLRWMVRAMNQSEAGIAVHLDPRLDAQVGLEDILDQTAERLSTLGSQGKPQHLYVELPWSCVDESLEIEEWLSRVPALGSARPQWNLSFVGLCPFDAERLPRVNRLGLEEFSRSSLSAVVVATPHEGLQPAWLGTESLDFGKRVEVFEEALWDRAADRAFSRLRFFGDSDELDFYSLRALAREDHLQRVLTELSSELEKGLWGADLIWSLDGQQFRALSLHSGQWHAWSGNQKGWVQPMEAGDARILVSGCPVPKQELLMMLQSQSLN